MKVTNRYLCAMAEERDPFDGDYVGNIFGWRISMIGLVVILAFGLLIVGRHYYLDVPYGIEDPLEDEEERAKYAPAGAADRDTLNQ